MPYETAIAVRSVTSLPSTGSVYFWPGQSAGEVRPLAPVREKKYVGGIPILRILLCERFVLGISIFFLQMCPYTPQVIFTIRLDR